MSNLFLFFIYFHTFIELNELILLLCFLSYSTMLSIDYSQSPLLSFSHPLRHTLFYYCLKGRTSFYRRVQFRRNYFWFLFKCGSVWYHFMVSVFTFWSIDILQSVRWLITCYQHLSECRHGKVVIIYSFLSPEYGSFTTPFY